MIDLARAQGPLTEIKLEQRRNFKERLFLFIYFIFFAAMYPAAVLMVVIGLLTKDQIPLVLTCLGLWGICATYRSGSQTNQIEIAPRCVVYLFLQTKKKRKMLCSNLCQIVNAYIAHNGKAWEVFGQPKSCIVESSRQMTALMWNFKNRFYFLNSDLLE